MRKKIRNIIFTGFSAISSATILVSCTVKLPAFDHFEIISNVKNDTKIKVHIKNMPKNIKLNDVTISVNEMSTNPKVISITASEINGERIIFKFDNLKPGTDYELTKIEFKGITTLTIENAKFSVEKESVVPDEEQPFVPFKTTKPTIPPQYKPIPVPVFPKPPITPQPIIPKPPAKPEPVVPNPPEEPIVPPDPTPAEPVQPSLPVTKDPEPKTMPEEPPKTEPENPLQPKPKPEEPEPEKPISTPKPAPVQPPSDSPVNPIKPPVQVNPSNPEKPNPVVPEAPQDPKGIYKIYDKFSELINPDLNFINKNFKADKISEGKYRKNYRLHQIFRKSIWKFNKQANTFSWSIDEQWINNMILRDKGNVSNINLYLYIENINPENATDIVYTSRPIFRDYLEERSDSDMNRYSNPKTYYPLGIKFDWEKLKAQGSIKIITPKYFDVEVNYDSSQKTISFKIVAKTGVNFTDEPHIAQQGKHVFISSPDNFLSISFETNNNENKTIKKFETPSKAEEGGANVNAFDVSTVIPNKPTEPITNKENRYLLAGKVIDNTDNNNFVDEMEARTFANSAGTWTMWAKVKPSDPNDKRYYIFTNQHVFPVVQNNYDVTTTISLYKQVGRNQFPSSDEPKIKIWLMPFWGFRETEDRWGKKILANKFGNKWEQILNRDMQVSIIDLNNVFAEIDGYYEKNKNKYDLSDVLPKLKTLRGFFEKWSTFKPLEFTDDYKLINSGTQYLDDWIVTSHAGGLAQTYFTKFTDSNINKIVFRGEAYDSKTKIRGFQLLVKGASGSLIVRGDKKLIGINNQLGGGTNFGQLFYTSQLDSIGSNADGSDPSKNNNPTTLGKAIIEAHKKYPDKYEILDMFK